jgi:aspartyl-tRNA synthetase
VADTELAAFYRAYNACCNEHRFDDLGEFVAPHVAINGHDRGLDVYAENLRSVVRGFPDYHWEIRHLVIDEPWIAVHLADAGTHRATFYGVEATGRTVRTPEFAFYRVAQGGRIAEVWGMAFHLPLLDQIPASGSTPRRAGPVRKWNPPSTLRSTPRFSGRDPQDPAKLAGPQRPFLPPARGASTSQGPALLGSRESSGEPARRGPQRLSRSGAMTLIKGPRSKF